MLTCSHSSPPPPRAGGGPPPPRASTAVPHHCTGTLLHHKYGQLVNCVTIWFIMMELGQLWSTVNIDQLWSQSKVWSMAMATHPSDEETEVHIRRGWCSWIIVIRMHKDILFSLCCPLVPSTLSLAVILEVGGEEPQPPLMGKITNFVGLIPGFKFIRCLCHSVVKTINWVKRSSYHRNDSMLPGHSEYRGCERSVHHGTRDQYQRKPLK